MTTVYIGLGTNIERHQHVEAGLKELALLGSNLSVSTIYECEAVGFESQPFFNLVVKFDTLLSLDELATQLRAIEVRWGRPCNAQKNQPRTLDLDILLYGDLVSDKPTLPRDDIYKFAFVIQPLFELSPDLLIPGTTKTVKQLWQASEPVLTQKLTEVEPWFDINN
ncbi:2-amino-4-hydroxy-6-hydroxymethyldihydropteridine diphosphokinase [Vibrio astriarenae]|jgi:2-amino-4-hydroxy-6-hydroxymethyldihydropteridine diphosphokinase|uniref:2-amino-4-hydroxy-6-hydroxymethyldihydropteridine diphosphokinase n=1 Tax=Vibrio agarivorans TaxID=153622 RepID=A0ABT7XWQ1_9VIBR|nr:2-amino-4-hydroxy-6-hydroxymethyldihydropteridine diphosphokinase [Vibrio agarivorans]MDN2480196.1 2-amino-4-hydroxy-6-hydroxymethyldihydropteridine diphosphokinase [Vibrio agarivorans]